jgi:cytochrome c oxidase assembly factor CtaG
VTQSLAWGVCPWLCRAPQQPDTPFAWPTLFVVDIFRLYIAVAALILVALSVWAIRRSGIAGQKGRFAFAALMTFGAFGTELQQIGMWPHWRFVVYFAGVTIGLWSYWRHLFCEMPAQDRHPEQDSST